MVAALCDAKERVVAMARDPAKAAALLPSDVPVRIADYEEPSSLHKALIGIKRLVFIPSDGDAVAVIRQHSNLVNALRRSEVSYVVFVSIIDVSDTSPFYFAPVYRDTEQRLREIGLPTALLRCNLYAEFVRDQYLRPALAHGRLSVPFGKAKVSPVTRSDVAACTAALTLRPSLSGQSFSLTGPALLSGDDLAATATPTWRKELAYEPLPTPDYLLQLLHQHPPPWPHAFSSMALSISEGFYGAVHHGVHRLLGRAPLPLETVLGDDAFP